MVFITVRHGANKETLFNQDCGSAALLRAIRDKCCELGSNAIIDLSDKDGNVKDLRKYPHMTAKEVLADREDCVLLIVGENKKGKVVFTPLLENEEIVTKAFLEKLAKGSKRESNKGQKGLAGRGSGGPSSGGSAGAAATSQQASVGKKAGTPQTHGASKRR